MTTKNLFLSLLAAIATTSATAAEPWKSTITDKQQNATLKMDLHSESIEVPGMEMYGPMHGYLTGSSIYGTWIITSCKINTATKATLRLSNDLGSETQEATLTIESDTAYTMKLNGQIVIKRIADKRRLVKVSSTFNFTKK